MNIKLNLFLIIGLLRLFDVIAIPERIVDCDIGQKEAVNLRWQQACTAMSIAAAAYLFHEPLDQIEPLDLFSIILLGGNFYDELSSPEKELAADSEVIDAFNRYLIFVKNPDYRLVSEQLGVEGSAIFLV